MVILPENAWTEYWTSVVSSVYFSRDNIAIVNPDTLLRILQYYYDITEEHFLMILIPIQQRIIEEFDKTLIKGEFYGQGLKFTFK